MVSTNPMIPSNEWRLLTVTIPPKTRDLKYAALAPGCIKTPHAGSCGCMTFDSQSDGDSYIRGKLGR
jgi:hypothetical protein